MMKLIDHYPHKENLHKESSYSGNEKVNYFFRGFFSGFIFAFKNPNFICNKSKNDSNNPSDNSGWNGCDFSEAREKPEGD